MNIEGLRLTAELAAPDLRHQRLQQYHLAGLSCQQRQQIKGARGQPQLLAAENGGPCPPIDNQFSDDQGLGCRDCGLARDPAQHGRDPGEQRVHVIGFGDVVVSAQLEPQHLIPATPPGRQQDHGQPELALEDAQRVQAVYPGQPISRSTRSGGAARASVSPAVASPAVRTR